MADYNPPTEDLPIFDASVFNTADIPLTQAAADKRYLRYPNAQGTENLLAVNVNGVADFKAGLDISDPSNTVSSEIDQNNTELFIKSGSATNTPSSELALYATDIAGNDVKCVSVKSTGTTISTATSFSNVTTGSLTSSAVQPASSDSSDKIPTTAWVQSAISAIPPPVQKTYTVAYTTTQSIVTPSGCSGIGIHAIGRGGQSGNSVDNFSYVGYISGGSGSGGNSAWIGRIPISAGVTLTVTINGTNTTGYSEIVNTTTAENLCKVYNGNPGTNGNWNSGSPIAGTGGTVNTTASVVNTSYGAWTSALGTAGSNGAISPMGSSGDPAYKAAGTGVPKGTIFTNTGYGCGQQYFKTGNYGPPSDPWPTGVVYVTYFLA